MQPTISYISYTILGGLLCYATKVEEESFSTQKLEDNYSPSPYHLENYCNENKESAEFFIDSWKGAILQLGYLTSYDGFPKSRRIHKCKIKITTKEEFWLVAAVEHMKIRGKRDVNNKWQCSDYLKFVSPGRNIVHRVLDVFKIDLINNIFSSKKTEELCGDKSLNESNMDYITEVSTEANSFYTASNEMSITFHQDFDERHYQNNSFKVVVTTFRHAGEQVECEGKQKCHGRDIYCIDPSFICDGHVNCAFPDSATDEKLCKAARKPKIFNMTSIIIITLTSLVSFGILVCIVTTLVCRVKSQLCSRRRESDPARSSVPLSPYPSAPETNFEPEETLPPYETVIMSDIHDKNSLEIEEGELPPKYESLFPDEPTQKPNDEKES